jgi:hypothetical protein
MITALSVTGCSIGMMMYRYIWNSLAPSTRAASRTSSETLRSPPR